MRGHQENLSAALDIARAADLQWHLGPTLLGLDHVRACTGRYGEAWIGMQETLHWLESLQQVRYQLIAHDFIGHVLLDLDLNELAIEHLERGLALGRDTGMTFWRAAIEAHVAVARSRLGRKDTAAALQATLEQTRRTSERYLMVRCIDALAEIALADGDASRCGAYADELLGDRRNEWSARARSCRAPLARRGSTGSTSLRPGRSRVVACGRTAQGVGRVRLADGIPSHARPSVKPRVGPTPRRHRAMAGRIDGEIREEPGVVGLRAPSRERPFLRRRSRPPFPWACP